MKSFPRQIYGGKTIIDDQDGDPVKKILEIEQADFVREKAELAIINIDEALLNITKTHF